MWVRCGNKSEHWVNTDNIVSIGIDQEKNSIVCQLVNGRSTWLGQYERYEEAKSALYQMMEKLEKHRLVATGENYAKHDRSLYNGEKHKRHGGS